MTRLTLHANRLVAAVLLSTLGLLSTGCPSASPPVDSGPIGAQQVGAEYGLTVRYDRDTSTVVMTDGRNRVSATTATPYVMINDSLVELPSDVFYNGAEVFFPGAVRGILEDRLRR